MPSLDPNALFRGLDVSEPTHFSFLPDNDDPNRVGAWLRFDGSELRLEPDLPRGPSRPSDTVAFLNPRRGQAAIAADARGTPFSVDVSAEGTASWKPPTLRTRTIVHSRS